MRFEPLIETVSNMLVGELILSWCFERMERCSSWRVRVSRGMRLGASTFTAGISISPKMKSREVSANEAEADASFDKTSATMSKGTAIVGMKRSKDANNTLELLRGRKLLPGAPCERTTGGRDARLLLHVPRSVFEVARNVACLLQP